MPDLTVPAYSVRFLLQTSQEHLTPRFYQRFLKESGLERFNENLPPLELVPVATREEIANFMGKAFDTMGNAVYSLFCQNVANSQFKLHAQLPLMQKYKAKVEQIINDPKLSPVEKVMGWLEVSQRLPKIDNAYYIAEGTTVVFTAPTCRYCSAVKADAMVCYVEKFYFQLLFKWVTGWNFVIEQTHSLARGDEACVLRLSPVDAK
jgi:hypothetical protein